MSLRVAEILAEMRQNRNDRSVSVQAGLMAELLAIIADDQMKSAEQLESHTRVLVEVVQAMLTESKVLRKLTVALLVLTAGLLIVTIGLVVLEYRPHP